MSSPKRSSLFFSWFAFTLATWLALAGAVRGLIHDADTDLQIPTWHWLLAWALPSLAVICGWQALRAANACRPLFKHLAGVIFWMGTVAGIVLVAALLEGRLEASAIAGDRQLLLLAALLPILPVIFVCVRALRTKGADGESPAGFGWLLDIPLGILCLLALMTVAWSIWLKTSVEPARLKAGQRWAEIGLPMPEFEKSLQPVEENQSLRDLTADLAPFGIVTLYKPQGNMNGASVAESKQRRGNRIQTPAELMDLYVATATIPGDWIKNVPKASAWLDSHADDFNHLYQGLLQRDPPVWSCNPADGLMVRLPDFLALRTVAELILADAYHRVQKNDIKGATDAVTAGLRMVQNLGEQPLMVSNMTYANIEAMYVPVIARLPAGQDDMQRLSDAVAAGRSQFARTMQWEAWSVMNQVEPGIQPAEPIELKATMHHSVQDMGADANTLLPIQPLPLWLGRLLYPLTSKSLGRLYRSKDWLYEADLVQISKRAPELVATDLGAAEMDAAKLAHLTPYAQNWTHAWLRINFVLLIREQANMIRYARAQMQAGKTGDLGSQQSAVIPGAKWQITGDAGKNSIIVRLTPVPKWATDSSVMGDPFFLIPLDGRRPWQLLTPPKQP